MRHTLIPSLLPSSLAYPNSSLMNIPLVSNYALNFTTPYTILKSLSPSVRLPSYSYQLIQIKRPVDCRWGLSVQLVQSSSTYHGGFPPQLPHHSLVATVAFHLSCSVTLPGCHGGLPPRLLSYSPAATVNQSPTSWPNCHCGLPSTTSEPYWLPYGIASPK